MYNEATGKQTAFEYVIKTGDTLWKLANRYNTTTYAIMRVNQGIGIHNLQIGQTIRIPGTNSKMNNLQKTDFYNIEEMMNKANESPQQAAKPAAQAEAEKPMPKAEAVKPMEEAKAEKPAAQDIMNSNDQNAGENGNQEAAEQMQPENNDSNQQTAPAEENANPNLSPAEENANSEVGAAEAAPAKAGKGKYNYINSTESALAAEPAQQAPLEVSDADEMNSAGDPPAEAAVRPDPADRISRRELNLNNDLRRLWMEHTSWTKTAIASIVDDSDDTNAVVARLLKNPEDFEDLLRPFYGQQAANRFSELLRNHLVIASELVEALDKGNRNAAEQAERRWYQNADRIAAFLASINPYFSEARFKDMMYEHLAVTKAQAQARIKGNYNEEIRLADQNEDLGQQMAQEMIRGIVRQFPQRF